MSGITNLLFSTKISSASTVVLPLPPSAINLAFTEPAFVSFNANSNAAGIKTSHS